MHRMRSVGAFGKGCVVTRALGKDGGRAARARVGRAAPSVLCVVYETARRIDTSRRMDDDDDDDDDEGWIAVRAEDADDAARWFVAELMVGRGASTMSERRARAMCRDAARRRGTRTRARRIAKRARAALEVAVEVARVVARHSWARRAALAATSRACVWALSGA